MIRCRWSALLASLLTAGCLTTIVGQAKVNATPPSDAQLFSADAWVRTPLPAGAPVDAGSAAGIAYVDAHDPNPYPHIKGISDSWGIPFAVATCADPVWRFVGEVDAADAFLKTEGFHAPADFADRLTRTSDSPMTVVDTCGVPSMPRGLAVRGHDAVKGSAPLTIRVDDGSSFDITSNGLDGRNPESTNPLNRGPRGNIVGDTLIRNAAVQEGLNGANGGTLGYRPEMFWWETDTAAAHVFPLVAHEHGHSGWGPEGIIIRVKPSWVAPSGCTGPALVIARTLQTYGAVIGDNAGKGGSGLKAEQGNPLPGMSETMLGACVTWNDMEFVQRGWRP
jgi:hypothetical protein